MEILHDDQTTVLLEKTTKKLNSIKMAINVDNRSMLAKCQNQKKKRDFWADFLSTRGQFFSDGMNTEIRNNLSISIKKIVVVITISSVNPEAVNLYS